jgi:nicotinamide riboside kinase
MNSIWRGQAALQRQVAHLDPKALVIQDTDLFSTIGYWRLPNWKNLLGEVPDRLVADALQLKSDLYIVTPSNIPFEADSLRYGGDKRESDDQYWIDLLTQYRLPYIVLKSSARLERVFDATQAIERARDKKEDLITYDRKGL